MAEFTIKQKRTGCFKVELPNILSICWMIICLHVAIVGESQNRNIFDYLLYITIICYPTIALLRKKRFENAGKKVLICFFALLSISIIGLTKNLSRISITSLIGIICVTALVFDCGYLCDSIQSQYIKPFFYFAIFRLMFRTLHGENLGNTIPGVLCFLSFGYLICVMDTWNYEREHQRFRRLFDTIIILGSYVLMIYIGWKSDARTAVFTAIGIFLVYVFFEMMNMSIKNTKKFFWIVCLFSIILTVAYINIHSFSWYGLVNQYSLSSFGKNVDSSRPALWTKSLETLSLIEVFTGKGTGVLPTYRGYLSFHNSFIQLIMQNGIIGLIPLISVLYVLWYSISEGAKDKVCRMILACFVGVIIYNLFECTLLQNKVFLGMCEWIIICMGVIRSRKNKKQFLLFEKGDMIFID